MDDILTEVVIYGADLPEILLNVTQIVCTKRNMTESARLRDAGKPVPFKRIEIHCTKNGEDAFAICEITSRKEEDNAKS